MSREIVNAGAWEEHQIHIASNSAPQAANLGYRYQTQTPKGNESNTSINNIQMGSRQGLKPRQDFNFDDLGMTTEEAFDELVAKEMITLVTNYVPKPGEDESKYCRFHQGVGHVTNSCITLKKIIQGLVDAGKFAKVKKANTVTNPLPEN